MSRFRPVLAAFLLAACVATQADAATKYKNCKSLNKTYPHGVGRPGAIDKTKGQRVTNFTRNAAVYNAVKKSLDRDHDGIACEKL